MPKAKAIFQFFVRSCAWIMSNRVGVLLLLLQAVGIVGMLFYRDNIDAAFWIWGVVIGAAGLGFLGLKNRSPKPTLDWVVFGSSTLLAALSAYFVFLK